MRSAHGMPRMQRWYWGVQSRPIQREHPPVGTDHKDMGVAISAAINRKWDGVRGAGMEGFPILRYIIETLNYLNIAMDLTNNLTSATTLTARREASSTRITTIFGMRSPTL